MTQELRGRTFGPRRELKVTAYAGNGYYQTRCESCGTVTQFHQKELFSKARCFASIHGKSENQPTTFKDVQREVEQEQAEKERPLREAKEALIKTQRETERLKREHTLSVPSTHLPIFVQIGDDSPGLFYAQEYHADPTSVNANVYLGMVMDACNVFREGHPDFCFERDYPVIKQFIDTNDTVGMGIDLTRPHTFEIIYEYLLSKGLVGAVLEVPNPRQHLEAVGALPQYTQEQLDEMSSEDYARAVGLKHAPADAPRTFTAAF
jgi:hypothetical protein